MVVDDGPRLGAAARLRRASVTSFDLVIHPNQRGIVDEAIVGGALSRCGSAPSKVTVSLNSADMASWQLLRRLGFEEARRLDRLVLDLNA